MLKIKDNVDLKELEKFMFVKNGIFYDLEINGNENVNNTWLYINIHSRCIYSEPDFKLDDEAQEIIFDKLFELIQAGLVEKVGE